MTRKTALTSALAFGTSLALAFGLALALAASPGSSNQVPSQPPSKLSDLHRFVLMQVQEALGTAVKGRPVIIGLSDQILSNGRFRKIDLELQPFRCQELNFEKFELALEHFWVRPEALKRWQLEVEKVGDSLSRLVFSLPSLEKKLQTLDPALKVKPLVDKQKLEVSGRGRFLLIPLGWTSQASLHWDGKALRLKPASLRWGGIRIPLWLSWLGSKTLPEAPLLDLGRSWLPLNIQEIHLSWDTVTLSTNW